MFCCTRTKPRKIQRHETHFWDDYRKVSTFSTVILFTNTDRCEFGSGWAPWGAFSCFWFFTIFCDIRRRMDNCCVGGFCREGDYTCPLDCNGVWRHSEWEIQDGVLCDYLLIVCKSVMVPFKRLKPPLFFESVNTVTVWTPIVLDNWHCTKRIRDEHQKSDHCRDDVACQGYQGILQTGNLDDPLGVLDHQDIFFSRFFSFFSQKTWKNMI